MSDAIQQLIESQRMLLNALESAIRDSATPHAKETPPIVHANQDEMGPEEELEYALYVENERQELLRTAGRAKTTLEKSVEAEPHYSEETEEEPVLLDYVVGTMDKTRRLDQDELMDALNL